MRTEWVAATAAVVIICALVGVLLLRPKDREEPIPMAGQADPPPGPGSKTVNPPENVVVPPPPGMPGTEPIAPVPGTQSGAPEDGKLPDPGKGMVHRLAGWLPLGCEAAGPEQKPAEDPAIRLEAIEKRNAEIEEGLRKADERKTREHKMFKDVVKDLTDEQADKVRAAFEESYSEAYRRLRESENRGEGRTEKEIYAEVRAVYIEKLKDVLDSEQLRQFSAWWDKVEKKEASEKPDGR